MQPASWQEAFGEGQAAYASGNLDDAAAKFRRALALAEADPAPEYAAATENALGVVLLEQGAMDEAAKSFSAALNGLDQAGQSKTFLFVATLTNLGDVELRQGEPKNAEAHYQRATQISATLPPSIRVDSTMARDDQIAASQKEIASLAQRARRGWTAALCAQGRLAEAQTVGASVGVTCKQSPQ